MNTVQNSPQKHKNEQNANECVGISDAAADFGLFAAVGISDVAAVGISDVAAVSISDVAAVSISDVAAVVGDVAAVAGVGDGGLHVVVHPQLPHREQGIELQSNSEVG